MLCIIIIGCINYISQSVIVTLLYTKMQSLSFRYGNLREAGKIQIWALSNEKRKRWDTPSNSIFLFRQLYSILISTILYDRGGLIDCGGDHAWRSSILSIFMNYSELRRLVTIALQFRSIITTVATRESLLVNKVDFFIRSERGSLI